MEPAPVPHAANFRIDAADENHLSLGRLGAIRHNYHLHPLMQIQSLASLAKKLSLTDQCRFIAPDTKVTSVFHHQKDSPDGRGIEDVFRDIEKSGSWVALYNVQTDPTYRQFVWDVMESARHIVAPQEQVFDVRGFIFISAPPSVTPLHIDRENNFWLQVHGRKTLNVWDRRDRDIVPATEVENFISWGGGPVPFKEEMLARSSEFDCGPGDGVYFPSTSPHMTRSDTSWVEPGNGVTVSIGIVFYTNVTRRDAYVHTVNQLMRTHLGFQPSPPGESTIVDRLKYPVGRLTVALRHRFRGYTPPPGF
ncbi:MAG: hypothetical protein ABL931_12960 [Usitatibacteraceae bacterium]